MNFKDALTLKENIGSFQNALNHFRGIFKFFELKTVLLKFGRRKYPFVTQINLIQNLSDVKKIETLPETENIQTFQRIFDVGKIDATLRDINKCILRVDNKKHHLFTKNKEKIRSWYFDGFHPDFPNLQRRLIALKIVFDEPLGLGQPPQWAFLNWELRAAEIPIHDLRWLFIRLGFLNPQLSEVHYPVIDIFLIPPFSFDYESANDQKDDTSFVVKAKIPKPSDINDIKVGVNSFSGNSNRMKNYPLKEVGHLVDDQIYEIKVSRDGNTYLELYLSYKNRCFDRISVTDGKFRNPRIMIHEKFDKSMEIFNKTLLGVQRKPKLFEEAICQLLHFAGYQTEHFADCNIKDEIDVVAYSSEFNSLVLAECTTSTPGISDKFSKVVRKVSEIKDLYEENRIPLPEIIPCIFCERPQSRISRTEMNDASQNKIAIVSLEKINEFFNKAQYMYKIGDLNDFLKSCIPPEAIPGKSSEYIQPPPIDKMSNS